MVLKDWSQISPWGAFKQFDEVLCLSSVDTISLWKKSSFTSPERKGFFPWTEPSSTEVRSILPCLPQSIHSRFPKKTRAQTDELSQSWLCHLTVCRSWICAENQVLSLIPQHLGSADCPSKLIRKITNLHPLCLSTSNWLSIRAVVKLAPALTC